MTFEELNALVEDAYAAAFAFEEQLTRVYLVAFDRAARQAEREFRANVVTVTAAGFVPPPTDSLTSGMTEEEEAQADRVREHAAEAVAAVLIALGLTVDRRLIHGRDRRQRGSSNFEARSCCTCSAQTVERGLEEGWTADETALAIRDAFSGVSPTTAQMLAQTELTTLVNERSLQAAMKQSEGVSEAALQGLAARCTTLACVPPTPAWRARRCRWRSPSTSAASR